MTFGEKLLLVVAALMGLLGLLILAGALIGTLEHTSSYSLLTDILLAIALGVLPIVGGIWLYKRIRDNVARRQGEEREKLVLQVAQQHQGMITAIDVATSAGMTLEQAKDALDQLNLKGFNDMDVSESGTIVYKFRL